LKGDLVMRSSASDHWIWAAWIEAVLHPGGKMDPERKKIDVVILFEAVVDWDHAHLMVWKVVMLLDRIRGSSTNFVSALDACCYALCY
jgi:hypothetical protein